MSRLPWITLFCLSLASQSLLAQPLAIGEVLPALDITRYGELVMDTAQDEVVMEPWTSRSLQDGQHMHILIYMAPSFSARNINAPLAAAMDSPPMAKRSAYIEATTIVYINDSNWGGPEITLGQIRYQKRKHPEARIVADANGQGLQAWSLQPDSHAVAILDPAGKVLFFKEGVLSEADIQAIVQTTVEGADALQAAASLTSPSEVPNNKKTSVPLAGAS